MIFATVGSHPTFAFDRLLRALEEIGDEELAVQHGPGRPPANAAETFEFMPLEAMLDYMARASVVVSHAGVGSILCARRADRVPVVMPRETRYGETVDDHQVQLAETLAPAGRIVLARDAAALPRAVTAARRHGQVEVGDGAGLADAVRAQLLDRS